MQKNNIEILAMVMAGGRGERLYPLTAERTKPSVPFGGKYRIIDFALSNFINSGIYSIYVLVQYKSQSLIEHIRTTWIREGILPKHFITVVPPQMRKAKEWYRGTADSVFQNINLIYDFQPKYIAIFGGDHIYRMNIKEMIDFHISKKAKLTVAVIPLASERARQFGIVDFDKDFKIKEFKEKPVYITKKNIYASMGNYIFDANFLVDVLEEDAKCKSSHDFGKDIIPYLVKKKEKIYAYDFSENNIPSLKSYEDKYYWKDVGTISNYFEANMDLLGKTPKLDLDNKDWPIYASNLNCPPAYIKSSQVENSLICEGSRLVGCKVKNSILGRGIIVEENCTIEDSIVLDFCHIKKGSSIKRTIIDRFNYIKENTYIGYVPKKDKENYYVDSSGIVVIKRGPRGAFYF
ncbi:MAG: glucose-1-phosphate adenylyltransferase [Candidatus Omnitrophica bacterium]|nr:glucose-1-phosphate adenylyltransferase [Candidatus Omnitrophota bacterium]